MVGDTSKKKLVGRHKRVAFMDVTGDGKTYTRMTGFTSLSDGKNSTECVNPKVLMNGYPYEVLTTLEKNEYLIINSSEQTIMKYLSNGTIANLFDVRGYDYSVFEKIPSGLISVNWSGDFGIDLYVFLKRKEAAW